MIKIKSKREGFRRCGLAHSAQWQFYDNDFFTDEQLERLFAEPMLNVEIVEDSPAQATSDEVKLEPYAVAEPQVLNEAETDQQPASGHNEVAERKKPIRSKKQE
ncbi:MAG: hypothetical protein CTY18_02930 [Methylomonas sp.]|nr:MAG: hypothetical protein CTY18_02930 [Methylomonas sp.]